MDSSSRFQTPSIFTTNFTKATRQQDWEKRLGIPQDGTQDNGEDAGAEEDKRYEQAMSAMGDRIRLKGTPIPSVSILIKDPRRSSTGVKRIIFMNMIKSHSEEIDVAMEDMEVERSWSKTGQCSCAKEHSTDNGTIRANTNVSSIIDSEGTVDDGASGFSLQAGDAERDPINISRNGNPRGACLERGEEFADKCQELMIYFIKQNDFTEEVNGSMKYQFRTKKDCTLYFRGCIERKPWTAANLMHKITGGFMDVKDAFNIILPGNLMEVAFEDVVRHRFGYGNRDSSEYSLRDQFYSWGREENTEYFGLQDVPIRVMHPDASRT
ncbi:hypothetical protein BKA61DRAFT_670708 [Leptodontidium sp. MPI-SDFR-AT-0119]|nr:hypothetical protein BKA61DRAFT_670708 [Leptodontidium sp. MPI-SDFR-AT-0119]